MKIFMRRPLLAACLIATAACTACSLIVGTDGLSEPAASNDGGDGSASLGEGGGTPDGGVSDATTETCTGSGCVAPPIPPCDGPCLPVDIADEFEVRGIAADESGVYWTATNPGDIKRADVDGKNVVVVFNGNKAPGHLALDANNVYWTEANGQNIRAVPKNANSGALVGELTGQGDVLAIAVTGSDVFFHDRATGEVRKTTTALGAPSVFTTNPPPGLVMRLAADANAVYIGVSSSSTNLVRRTLRSAAGTPPVDLTATKGQELLDIAIDAARVYVVDGDLDTVIGVTHDGSNTITYSAVDGTRPSSVAVDGTHVYWTNAFAGTVQRAPKAGGAVETLATGQGTLTHIAVNSAAVYWTTSGGRVVVLRKP